MSTRLQGNTRCSECRRFRPLGTLFDTKNERDGGVFVCDECVQEAVARFPHPPSPLSPRLHETLVHLCSGASSAEIAKRMGITINTANYHLDTLYKRIGANGRALAVATAFVDRIVRAEELKKVWDHWGRP